MKFSNILIIAALFTASTEAVQLNALKCSERPEGEANGERSERPERTEGDGEGSSRRSARPEGEGESQ